ncbi:uncharacterized protein LOC122260112 [Penaeus japonicus]|uniref:uncharacterized protein LOC122260112 n=1 Tax=Penaeus japonicus TaxID=27405 RepID=UPI001C7109D8|nr:uncharacterized protein LOC122260112 [Penaeus japonicus]
MRNQRTGLKICIKMLVILALAASTHADTITARNQTDRFLSLFSVVRFKNTGCTGSSGDSGTCYAKHTCLFNGGNLEGTCAGGFGHCCVTKIGCGGVSRNNCTYIESPGYPNTFSTAMTCKQTIMFNRDVCQLRLDVTEVDLAPPDNRGMCLEDVLTFSQDIKWSQVCGTTLNTHYYLDVDPDTSTKLDFDFNIGAGPYPRKWKIKVSQICCDQLSMAPMGCGQYFTSTTGTIKAWNTDSADRVYLHGQNYATCLRKEIDRCTITYTETMGDWFLPRCGDTLEFPFNIIQQNNPATGITCLGPGGVSPVLRPATASLQGPQQIYFVTGDGTNNHVDVGQNSNLDLEFSQGAC